MSFASPWWLFLGALIVITLAIAAVAAARRRQTLLAEAGLTAGRRRGPLGLWLTVAGLGVLAIAVAGPAASVPVSRAAGTVIIAVDVSNSMGATDVSPTRLSAGKKSAAAFVDAQPDSVDIGVVAFQNGALTVDSPSADHAAAQAAIERLRVSGGTSLANAILTSLSAISGKKVAVRKDGTVPDIGYWGSATIVLFSDGEDTGSEQTAQAAATAAENAGVHIETVGVGTAAGATINTNGYRVHTALEADTLTAIAKTSGGTYHPASDAAQLDGIASTIDLRLTTHHEQLPLAGAFTAFAILLLAAGGVFTVLRTGRVV
jgi:Ca-activated chloride channel family protein